MADQAKPVAKPKPGYVKQQLKKGDKVNYPHVGDTVHCWYTGYLSDGVTIFDSNCGEGGKKKQRQPLSFKVGKGKVIKGWDEALLTMSKGEKSKLTIEPDWAYGSKGNVAAGIPKDEKLIFEVELVNISF
ncbi:C-terminal domain of murine Fkbp25 Rapamycin complex [Neoconidiobolus thromboides FSU 785]|nr:C-terminal domain of murine Fkbp25 Rapamycin complex [Neoconidiobolus thromboides FSU 785]